MHVINVTYIVGNCNASLPNLVPPINIHNARYKVDNYLLLFYFVFRELCILNECYAQMKKA